MADLPLSAVAHAKDTTTADLVSAFAHMFDAFQAGIHRAGRGSSRSVLGRGVDVVVVEYQCPAFFELDHSDSWHSIPIRPCIMPGPDQLHCRAHDNRSAVSMLAVLGAAPQCSPHYAEPLCASVFRGRWRLGDDLLCDPFILSSL